MATLAQLMSDPRLQRADVQYLLQRMPGAAANVESLLKGAPGTGELVGDGEGNFNWVPYTQAGYEGLTSYNFPAVRSEGNESYIINPGTGRQERAFQGNEGTGGGTYLESDLVNKYGSLDAANKTGLFQIGNFGIKPSSNDPSDIIKTSLPLALPVIAGAMGLYGSGLAAGGEAAGAAGADVGSGLVIDEFGNVISAGQAAGAGGTGIGGGLTVDEFGNVVSGGTGASAGGATGIGGGMSVDAFGNVVGPAAGVGGAAAAGGLGTLLHGGDIASSLLRGLPGALGAIASKTQADAYSDLANKYFNVGAPSRARYEASFSPGFTMANDPGYTDALDQTTKSFLHKASITGNPADSPNAWMQTLKDVNSTFAYPALQDYRRLNAGSGGLAALTSAAPAADAASVKATGGIYDALGGAAADIFTPRRTLGDLLKELRV